MVGVSVRPISILMAAEMRFDEITTEARGRGGLDSVYAALRARRNQGETDPALDDLEVLRRTHETRPSLVYLRFSRHSADPERITACEYADYLGAVVAAHETTLKSRLLARQASSRDARFGPHAAGI